jgi:hypothetical protein
MFIMHMPESFKVGDTAACRINDEPAQLTWRSHDTLIIGDDDARRVVATQVQDGLCCFICGDASSHEDGTRYRVDAIPGDGGVIISRENFIRENFFEEKPR